MPHTTDFHVRAVAADRIDARDCAAWVELESRALEPNAYLSPHFVQPYARHLARPHVPQVLLIERQGLHGRELLGVAVVIGSSPSLGFPARRLLGYQTNYSPVGGLLLDRQWAEPALAALLRYAHSLPGQIGVLELPLVWGDGPLPALAATVADELGFEPVLGDPVMRAVLRPAAAPEQLRSRELAQRLRDLVRRQRRLQERGVVGWRMLGPADLPDSAVEALLALEHLGWKGDQGSSMRSLPSQERFFREMIAGFAAGRRAMFNELTFDGAPIASACTLLAGRIGFAFKIGWDPALRAHSPGLLNEIEFMRHAGESLTDVELVDSGASAGSYIDGLWPERRPLVTLTIPLRAIGRMALQARASGRWLKRRAAVAVAGTRAVITGRSPVLAGSW
ncbi:MAG: GNAT family N-acetyltransferase [Gammaproteobacteria bacterium]|nr:GNAT family N-acetyltransferase [Gammaproteobacteria bacterium]